MSKSIFILLLILGLTISGLAQHTIKGRVIDEKSEPLSHATVALLIPGDSTLAHFGITNAKGEYQIKQIKKGDFLMQFSFVGMETIYEPVTIPADSGENFGDKALSASMLKEVIVQAELIPIKFKSDTLEFDVKAFTTRPGAAVEELLEKLPGVEVDQAGNVKAEGEDVIKVLVDGKEFFDKDPKVATKNLPAKAVSKVQVFDKRSEEATFTGIDDGVRERTINLMLNEDHKKGYFGELAAGAGTNDTYKADGKIYRFSKTIQTALLGMYNNINEFGFTHKGNNQFGQGTKGLNTSLAGGVNLSYNKGSQNRYYLSYLGNSVKKELEEDIDTENFLPNGTYEQLQHLIETEKDKPHNVNFGIRHNFDKQNRLIIDGDFNIGSNDLVSHTLTNSTFENNPINRLDNNTSNRTDNLQFNAKGVYITKFNQEKTQLKTDIYALYTQNESRLDWINVTNLLNPPSEMIADQFRNNDTDRLRLSASPTLVQKITNLWSLDIGATFGLDNRSLNRREGMRNPSNEFIEFLIPGFSTNETFVKPTLSLQHATKKAQVNLTMGATASQFDKVLDNNSLDKPSYFYFLPRISYQNDYRTGRRLNMRYSTSVAIPSIEQLYPVVDSINQLVIYQGNIDLKPEYSHHLNLQWSLFDQFSFTSIFLRMGGLYTKDKISWSQSINEKLIKVTTPINTDYRQQLYFSMDFTTPIRVLGINMNIKSNENWNRGIVLINDQENINTNITHTLSLSFENRNKDKWSVRVGGNISLTDSKFSISESQNNLYHNLSYFSNIRFTPNKRWNVQARANVINYNSRSFDEAVSVPLITAGISHFFGEAENASLTLSGFDLLNKFVGFQRISNTNFLMQREWNTIGRYAMLTFRLRIRKN